MRKRKGVEGSPFLEGGGVGLSRIILGSGNCSGCCCVSSQFLSTVGKHSSDFLSDVLLLLRVAGGGGVGDIEIVGAGGGGGEGLMPPLPSPSLPPLITSASKTTLSKDSVKKGGEIQGVGVCLYFIF